MPAISLKGVSKRYKVYPSQGDRLKEALSFGRKKLGHEFWALRDVSLDIEPGTALGVLGRNGAGKSTLLKIISGVLEPTGGEVEVNGRLAALLQLGAGFNKEFTGKENVILNGLILGMDRAEIHERFEEIAAFADIGPFMDQPVKTYSSGMKARLGFAVATNVEPDVLVVDETLSVGDTVFKQMGLQKMRELRDSGTTVFFVSHSVGMVKSFCSEAILLHKGHMLAHGETAEVADAYKAVISGDQARDTAPRPRNDEDEVAIEYDGYEDEEELEEPSFREDPDLARRVAHLRRGTGEARVQRVELLDGNLRPTDEIPSYSTVTVRAHLDYLEAVKSSKLVVTLRNKAGLDVFSTNTALEGVALKRMGKGERAVVDFTFDLPLQHGLYSVTAAIARTGESNLYLDWVDVATAFKITRPLEGGPVRGMVHLPTEVKVHGSPGEGDRRDRPAS